VAGAKIILVPFSRWLRPVNQLAFDTKLHCDVAMQLWPANKGAYDYCAFTGGRWLPESIETVPIAELMRDYVVRGPKPIPADKIIVEPESVNTWENIEMLSQVLRGHGITKFELVCLSQWQHNARVWFICRALRVPARFVNLWYWPGNWQFFYECIGFVMTLVDTATYRLFGQPVLARLNAKSRAKK
jgi:hypothetical protein